MEETEESGITLGYIFKLIFSQKWLALIIAVVIAIGGTVLFWITERAKTEYSVSFELNLNDMDMMASYYTYEDGTKFFYSDYTSYLVLKRVKDSDSKFAGVDIEKMVKEGDISNDETVTTFEQAGAQGVVSTAVRRVITITATASCFAKEEVARDFLVALSRYPINNFSNVTVNYNVYLNESDFNNAPDFETQLNYLQNQIDYINTLYSRMANVADDNGELVASKHSQFNAWVSRIDLAALRTEASENYYLKDYQTSLDKKLDDKKVYERNRDNAQTILDTVIREAGGTDKQDVNLAATIAQWQKEVTDYQNLINIIENYENAYSAANVNAQLAKVDAYSQKIQAIYDELTKEDGLIDACATLINDVHIKESGISYLHSSYVVKTNSGRGVVKNFILSLIVGVVVALVVALVAGIISAKKKNKKPVEVIAVTNIEEKINEEENEEENKE